eukprot:Skav205286  [mRNA]  locus=scaffold1690:260322:260741:+ [translate_table: standard]
MAPEVSGVANQMWHKDSYWGLRKIRKHRPRWCMLLYYPQETEISMGPTCILSGSQYWTKDTEQVEPKLQHESASSMFDAAVRGTMRAEDPMKDRGPHPINWELAGNQQSAKHGMPAALQHVTYYIWVSLWRGRDVASER